MFFLQSNLVCLKMHIFGSYCEVEYHFDVYLLGQVVRMVAGNMATGKLYSHLIPVTLLLVDGNFLSFYYFDCIVNPYFT